MPSYNPNLPHLTRNMIALILAGGRGSRLMNMTDWRAKPAVPFGGNFRIIDFPLSNCVNSGIRKIGIMTQYKSDSLNRHIQLGWGFLRGEFGEYVDVMPAQQRLMRLRGIKVPLTLSFRISIFCKPVSRITF